MKSFYKLHNNSSFFSMESGYKPNMNKSTRQCCNNHSRMNSKTEFCKSLFKTKQAPIKKPTDDFICMLCRDIFKMPTSCYKCAVSFCNLCLSREVNNHGRCPNCRELVFMKMMKEDKAKLNKMINYVMKCRNKGCISSFNIIEMDAHLAVCPFSNLKSKYELLKMQVPSENENDNLFKNYVFRYTNAMFHRKSIEDIEDAMKNNFKNKTEFTVDLGNERLAIEDKTYFVKDDMDTVNEAILSALSEMDKKTRTTEESISTARRKESMSAI